MNNKLEKLVFPIKCKKVTKAIPLDEVCSLETVGKKVKITAIDGDYFINAPISMYEEYLTGSFVHVRKHLIINFDRVDKIENNIIYLENGYFITASVQSMIDTKRKYAAYIHMPNYAKVFYIKPENENNKK